MSLAAPKSYRHLQNKHPVWRERAVAPPNQLLIVALEVSDGVYRNKTCYFEQPVTFLPQH